MKQDQVADRLFIHDNLIFDEIYIYNGKNPKSQEARENRGRLGRSLTPQ